MKPNPIAKTIPFRLARLPILVGLTLTFILAAAFSLTLTDEEADQRLREMGFYVDDPFFPPDLLEAFRELARSMAASEDLFFVSSTESFTYAEGGLKPLEQMSPPSADSLNHGARISYDDAAGLFSFSWWGKADHEYIVEFSRDLMNWDIEPPYVVASDPLPVLNKGVDAPLEIEFESSADRLFLRLQVTSSSAAYEITSLELTEEDWTPFAPGRLLDLRETSYFRIEISPEIPSLQAALPLVSGLVIGEQEVTLNAANTEFENAGGATVLKLTIDPEEWTAGLSAMTIEGPLTKTAFDMGSINENAPSNLTDSDAFMENFNWNFMDQVQSLGRASEHPDDLPLNLDGIRYAGWYTVASHTAGEIYYPFYPYAYRQAKYFYYSGHGSHSTGELLLDDEVRIGANMMKWDDGLSVVILAGCSVLDINDYNDNSNSPSGWKPGDAWSSTGPSTFLGYNWSAPLDRQPTASGYVYAGRNIINEWINKREVRGDIQAWMEANDNSYGRNASAIDASQGIGDRIYWYWRHVSLFGQTLYYAIESVPEHSW